MEWQNFLEKPKYKILCPSSHSFLVREFPREKPCAAHPHQVGWKCARGGWRQQQAGGSERADTSRRRGKYCKVCSVPAPERECRILWILDRGDLPAPVSSAVVTWHRHLSQARAPGEPAPDRLRSSAPGWLQALDYTGADRSWREKLVTDVTKGGRGKGMSVDLLSYQHESAT